MDLRELRTDYGKGSVADADIQADPLIWFEKWFDQAMQSGIPEPNAMAVSTVSTEGKPSSRIVLLKELNPDGFHFFTNYNSRKGSDLAHNSNACLLFFWPQMERQIRVEGTVSRTSAGVSDAYFNQRPFESRVGAVVSPQSSVIPSREHLENLYDDFIRQADPAQIPRPAHWGGFVLKPVLFEFWQGRPGRLHDRIRFTRSGGDWKWQRLAP